MNLLQRFESEIKARLPQCQTSMDPPMAPWDNTIGVWFLDVQLDQKAIVVQFSPLHPSILGVSLLNKEDSNPFETRADVDFHSIDSALVEALELLTGVEVKP